MHAIIQGMVSSALQKMLIFSDTFALLRFFSLVLAFTRPTGANRLKNTLGPNLCGFGTQGNSRSVVYSPTLPKYLHFSLLSSYILTLIFVSVPIFQKTSLVLSDT